MLIFKPFTFEEDLITSDFSFLRRAALRVTRIKLNMPDKFYAVLSTYIKKTYKHRSCLGDTQRRRKYLLNIYVPHRL